MRFEIPASWILKDHEKTADDPFVGFVKGAARAGVSACCITDLIATSESSWTR